MPASGGAWTRPAVLSAVLIVAGAAGWGTWRVWSRGDAPVAAPKVAVPVAVAPSPAASALRAASRPPRPGDDAEAERLRERVAALRERARLPANLTPIAAGEPDPLAWRYPMLPPPGLKHHREGLAIFAYTDPFEIAAPGPVVLSAVARDGTSPIDPQTITGTLYATESKEQLATLTFADDGTGGDAAAGDHVFTASVTLPVDRRLSGEHRADLVATFADGSTRTTTGVYRYIMPVAWPTGEVTDRVADGALVVDVELEAPAASTAKLRASLHDATDVPIAILEAARELPAGRSRVPFIFAGVLFRDRDLAGPYVLAHLAIQGGGMEGRFSEQITALAYRTGAYPLTAFTTTPADDQRILDAAQQFEDYAARIDGRAGSADR